MIRRAIRMLASVTALACLTFVFRSEPSAAWEPPRDSDPVPDWMKGKEVRATYNGGIALLYEHRCVVCHRPGEVAPMSFLTYSDIRKWQTGATNTPLESLIQTRAMPPWPAEPAVGEFANSRFLTKREMDLLLEWIRSGFPRGEGTYKPTREWVAGWNIGKPDHVFELPKHTVAENVQAETREFHVETNFSEDRWIVEAEVRPGNEGIMNGLDAGPLGSYQPGNSHVIYTAGTGRLLRAGDKVRVRVQYAKAKGIAASDQSKLGVVFAKDPVTPRKNIVEDCMAATDFTIPAGAANFEVKARFQFPADGQIVSLMPVMHLRGKDVSYRAIFPDGTWKLLLSIPAWDPNWKYRYQLKTPLEAPTGTAVEATAHFDNSETNIRNPDPSVAVRSGSDGEVFEGWICYSLTGQ